MIISALSWAIEAALLFRFSGTNPTPFRFSPRLCHRPCLPMPNVLLFSSIGIYGVVYTKIAFAFCSWVSKKKKKMPEIEKGSRKKRGEVEKELKEKRKNRWTLWVALQLLRTEFSCGIYKYIWVKFSAAHRGNFPPWQPLAKFPSYQRLLFPLPRPFWQWLIKGVG